MRIATEPNYIPYLETVSLRKDVAKALIERGVFDHDPKKAIWVLPSKTENTTSSPQPAGAASPTAAIEMLALLRASAELLAEQTKSNPAPTAEVPQIAPPGPVRSLPALDLSAVEEMHPVAVPKRRSRKVERVFGLAEATIPLADLGADPAVRQVADAAAGLLGAAEMLYEWIDPKDRDTLEGALFWAQKSAVVANSVSDMVPALQPAKPYLAIAITLLKFGEEVRAQVHTDSQDAHKKSDIKEPGNS